MKFAREISEGMRKWIEEFVSLFVSAGTGSDIVWRLLA